MVAADYERLPQLSSSYRDRDPSPKSLSYTTYRAASDWKMSPSPPKAAAPPPRNYRTQAAEKSNQTPPISPQYKPADGKSYSPKSRSYDNMGPTSSDHYPQIPSATSPSHVSQHYGGSTAKTTQQYSPNQDMLAVLMKSAGERLSDMDHLVALQQSTSGTTSYNRKIYKQTNTQTNYGASSSYNSYKSSSTSAKPHAATSAPYKQPNNYAASPPKSAPSSYTAVSSYTPYKSIPHNASPHNSSYSSGGSSPGYSSQGGASPRKALPLKQSCHSGDTNGDIMKLPVACTLRSCDPVPSPRVISSTTRKYTQRPLGSLCSSSPFVLPE
eukprot:TRINITY_DN67258_c3_g1_i2.p1 TRINITY_DN67258_c3_g1~~TRINITY_DN67258_c3_g1_i2.p1  ORF type:complete len:343 (+),score=24.15 TRINITY_DN67258_c3_g1_i2:54-1031(+)